MHSEDEYYMQLALDEAVKGIGWVNPNPLVGAIIVKNGHVIGRGYHEKCGQFHAERNALADCNESPNGADMYVTLEPCCHYGKTPPCTEAIIEAGIKRVVIGSMDPNPLVAGKGADTIRQSGIEVVTRVLENRCLNINKVFFHYIQTKTPYVIMKYAMTLDGKTATYSGLSQWITSEAARTKVHEDRHRYSGIMVGVNTVRADNPSLTARLENVDTNNPVRIICDSTLRTPLDSQIMQTAGEVRTIIATICQDSTMQKAYTDTGCELIITNAKDNKVNLNELMIGLGERGIDSLIIEGGSELNWSALEAGIVNHVQAYIAPKIFGGMEAKSPIAGIGVYEPGSAYKLVDTSMTQLGCDILLAGDIQKTC